MDANADWCLDTVREHISIVREHISIVREHILVSRGCECRLVFRHRLDWGIVPVCGGGVVGWVALEGLLGV